MATEQIFRSLSGSEIHAVFGNIKFGDLQLLKYAVSRQKVPIYTMGTADARAIARGARSINGALVFSHLSTGGIVQAMREAGSKIFLSHDELANYNAEYMDTGNLSEQQRLALKASGSLGYVGYVTAGDNSNLTQGSTLANLQGSSGGTGFDPFSVGTSFNNLSNYGRLTPAWLADQLPPFDITLVGVPETAGNELQVNASYFKPQRLIIRGVEFTSESSGTSIEDLVIEKQMSFLARAINDWKSVDL